MTPHQQFHLAAETSYQSSSKTLRTFGYTNAVLTNEFFDEFSSVETRLTTHLKVGAGPRLELGLEQGLVLSGTEVHESSQTSTVLNQDKSTSGLMDPVLTARYRQMETRDATGVVDMVGSFYPGLFQARYDSSTISPQAQNPARGGHSLKAGLEFGHRQNDLSMVLGFGLGRVFTSQQTDLASNQFREISSYGLLVAEARSRLRLNDRWALLMNLGWEREGDRQITNPNETALVESPRSRVSLEGGLQWHLISEALIFRPWAQFFFYNSYDQTQNGRKLSQLDSHRGYLLSVALEMAL